jgi:phosphate/sulfate permease
MNFFDSLISHPWFISSIAFIVVAISIVSLVFACLLFFNICSYIFDKTKQKFKEPSLEQAIKIFNKAYSKQHGVSFVKDWKTIKDNNIDKPLFFASALYKRIEDTTSYLIK